MKKVKYFYNTNTLRYERLEIPLRIKLLRVFGFVASALVTAALIAYLAFRFIGSPKEKILELQNREIRADFISLAEQVQRMERQMKELEKRDNEVYRAIFEATPIPDSARAQELATQLEIDKVEKLGSRELVTSITKTVNNVLVSRGSAADQG
jgi:formiminotetrahydrofolate cyclodeaminase